MEKTEARTLFVDDGDIAAIHGVDRVIHPAVKYDGNPVVSPDQPWEGDEVLLGGTVRREGGRFRMWYQCNVETSLMNLYAESQNGINWTKPVLGLYEDFRGSVENNIYLNRRALRSGDLSPTRVRQDHNQNVLYTPHMGPGKTYTMLSYDFGRSGYSAYDGYFAAFSDDGLQWADGPEEPVIPGHADVGWFTYDERDRLFRAIVKNFLNIRGYKRRSVFWTESDDAFDWVMPRPALIPDMEDEEWAGDREGHHTQFYGMPIFRYESMLLGLLQVFKCTDGDASSDGTIDVQLASSRDGRHWHRVGDRSPIVERGPEGAWDWGIVENGNALVTDGDVVRTYFTGYNSRHGNHGIPKQGKRLSIGTASWPRDRFVGLRAGSAGGELLLTERQSGAELHVNANAAGGSLVAEISENGRPVQGFEASNCLPLTGDSLDHTISWRDAHALGTLQGMAVTVSIKLTNAEVFSLWWG